MDNSIFVFRRDLRLEDNSALIQALQASSKVLPIFIFDPVQLKPKNPYFSQNAFEFMCECLNDLNSQLLSKGSKLFIFYGEPKKIISSLLKTKEFSAVYSNFDYTPFSIARDKKIREMCQSQHARYIQFDDSLLNPPGAVLKKDGSPYAIFTPYFKRAQNIPVLYPKKNNFSNFFSSFSKTPIFEVPKHEKNPNLKIHGGTKNALKLLANINSQANYSAQKDFPALDSTTHLSAHFKFGSISPRQAYLSISTAFSKNHQLIRALYWRDFFTQIAFHFPNVFKTSFRKKYSKIKWSNPGKRFLAWKDGKTGFPLVDASMRELNSTGFMQNRCRMVVSSFLTKDLHINWREGEKYFAQKLVDYDPCVNNGNWQWAASTGCDAQPYFRIFNPWEQQKKFDPDCIYIKKWLPELENLSPKQIVSHKSEAKKAIAIYKKAPR